MIITLALYMALSQASFEPVKVDHPVVQVYENRQISQEDFELLCKIVWAEASGEPEEGQMAIVSVILNRVDSDSFPDTIKEVVEQQNQFCGIYRSEYGKTSDMVIKSVTKALKEPLFNKQVVFFSNVKTANDRKFINEVILPNSVAVIGNHTFSMEDIP